MNTEKYLPIGTVVLLKNATKKVMITGFAVIGKESNNRVYDYSGCLYPEGILSSDKNLLFDHNQIHQIYFLGYNSKEEKEFKEKFKKLLVEQAKRANLSETQNIDILPSASKVDHQEETTTESKNIQNNS